MSEINKIGVLKEILEENKLSEKHSSITFEALVSITTQKAELLNAESLVKIMTTIGREFLHVSILGENIDQKLFPKDIKVLLKDIEFIDYQYLKISRVNYVYENIGNYLIHIIPSEFPSI